MLRRPICSVIPSSLMPLFCWGFFSKLVSTFCSDLASWSHANGFSFPWCHFERHSCQEKITLLIITVINWLEDRKCSFHWFFSKSVCYNILCQALPSKNPGWADSAHCTAREMPLKWGYCFCTFSYCLPVFKDPIYHGIKSEISLLLIKPDTFQFAHANGFKILIFLQKCWKRNTTWLLHGLREGVVYLHGSSLFCRGAIRLIKFRWQRSH